MYTYICIFIAYSCVIFYEEHAHISIYIQIKCVCVCLHMHTHIHTHKYKMHTHVNFFLALVNIQKSILIYKIGTEYKSRCMDMYYVCVCV
jgi:hypothetical protein